MWKSCVFQLTSIKVETLNSLEPICTWVWVKASRTSLTINRNLVKKHRIIKKNLNFFLNLWLTLYLAGYPYCSIEARSPGKWGCYTGEYSQCCPLAATVSTWERCIAEWLAGREETRGHHSVDCRRLSTVQSAGFPRLRSWPHRLVPVEIPAAFVTGSASPWLEPEIMNYWMTPTHVQRVVVLVLLGWLPEWKNGQTC